MKKATLILIIGFFTLGKLYAQTDSLKKEILNYQGEKSLLIANGRKMILDKVLLDDKKKVKELLGFLIQQEDTNHIALYSNEKQLLFYYTGQYRQLIDVSSNSTNTLKERSYLALFPMRDRLSEELSTKLREHKNELKEQIKHAELSVMEQNFLQLNLDYLLSHYYYDERNQDSINLNANKFLLEYPNSNYAAYIKTYIRNEYYYSKLLGSLDIGSGYGVVTKNLQQNFKILVPLIAGAELGYKNFNLYVRGYLGNGKTKDSIPFMSGTWKKNAHASVNLYEASLGYAAFTSRKLNASPFLGYASLEFSPNDKEKKKNPSYENMLLKLPSELIGFNLDFKLSRNSDSEENYYFLRIRYAYSTSQFNKNASRFSGDFHYLTISLGGLMRRVKRRE